MEKKNVVPDQIMPERFDHCMIGSLILGLILSIAVLAVSGDATAAMSIILSYLFVSSLFYGILYFSRKQLRDNPGIFILGTIVVTSGGWWLCHICGWINVKINRGLFRVSSTVYHRIIK